MNQSHFFGLERVSKQFKQQLFESLMRGFGTEYGEIEDTLGLQSHNSRPMLRWDLTIKSLLSQFSSSNCVKCKSGGWEFVLLYDENSGILFSLMRDARLKDIKEADIHKRPLYFRALLTFNDEQNAIHNQGQLFSRDDEDPGESKIINERLNAICSQLQANGIEKTSINNHAIIVFSINENQIDLFEVCILDSTANVIFRQSWLEDVKPDILVAIECDTETERAIPKLTPKATELIKKKKLAVAKVKSDVSKEEQIGG